MSGPPRRLDFDWYGGGVPGNVEIHDRAYVDTSHCFEPFLSVRDPGLTLARGAGAYDRTAFVVGPDGSVSVGPYTCLNATYLICNDRISIGAHCLLAWGSVVTDSWLAEGVQLDDRRRAVLTASMDPRRPLPAAGRARPVVIEDNVWVGFDSVVMPGVRLGRGSVIGCRTTIREAVPPYSVVVGDPPRIIRQLPANDDPRIREQLMREHLRES